jgi:nucleotidyltransferase/DNA polymerase involved in DNA repair
MLATTGFENKHQVKIYENQVIVNMSEIKVAEKLNDPVNHPVPEPRTETKIYISARVPQSKSGFDGAITEKHKKTFPETWKAFQNRQEHLDEVGHALDLIPDVNTGIKERLESMGIKTIENLASCDDQVATKLPFGMKLREKAKKILESLDDKALEEASQGVKKLDKKFEEMMSRMDEMQEVILAQQEIINKKSGTKKSASA